MDKSVTKAPLLAVLGGEMQAIPPVWMMRQAGRYLPEYRKLREQAGSFLKLCLTPELAAEVTMQPIRRFGFDAAILFSDILVIPHALGQRVDYVEKEGPQLTPLNLVPGLPTLGTQLDQTILQKVYDTVALVRSQLDRKAALLGFCGAPWTVATYMIAGHGTADQAPARLAAYGQPDVFGELIDRLVGASIEYLVGQLKAGADAVQIFDTWAGVLPAAEFARWSIAPTKKIVAGVRAQIPGARIIGFPRGAGSSVPKYVQDTGVDAMSLDWMVAPDLARRIQGLKPVQGNLDPLALLTGGDALNRGVDAVLETFSAGPFIFNLGHGILPATPIAHVEQMLARVRGVGR